MGLDIPSVLGAVGLNSSVGVGAPTSGPFSTSNYSAPMTAGQAQGYASGYQQSNGQGTVDLASLYGMLQQQANGQGPNLAQAQAMQQGQNANKMFLGALAGNRGMSPGLAMQMAGQQAGQYQGQAIQQGAQAQLQQQLAAQQQMAGVGNQLQQNQQFNANSYNSLLNNLYGNMSNQTIANNNNVYGAYANGMKNLTATTGGLLNGLSSMSGLMSGGMTSLLSGLGGAAGGGGAALGGAGAGLGTAGSTLASAGLI